MSKENTDLEKKQLLESTTNLMETIYEIRGEFVEIIVQDYVQEDWGDLDSHDLHSGGRLTAIKAYNKLSYIGQLLDEIYKKLKA